MTMLRPISCRIRRARTVVTIAPIRVLRGHALRRVHSMVLEWAALHQEELLADWNLCKSLRTPQPIEPLE
ncbi:MAG: DUF4160 domain-containing protein [Myxococcales bacterium]